MTSSDRTGGKHRKPEDPPTERFPALQKALDKAFEPFEPDWPTTDPDEK